MSKGNDRSGPEGRGKPGKFLPQGEDEGDPGRRRGTDPGDAALPDVKKRASGRWQRAPVPVDQDEVIGDQAGLAEGAMGDQFRGEA
jgi:hypothetical protein